MTTVTEIKYALAHGEDSLIQLELDPEERNVMRVLDWGDIEHATLLRKEVADEYVKNIRSGQGSFWKYEIDGSIDLYSLRVVKATVTVDFS